MIGNKSICQRRLVSDHIGSQQPDERIWVIMASKAEVTMRGLSFLLVPDY
jgi:hypothetical protein